MRKTAILTMAGLVLPLLVLSAEVQVGEVEGVPGAVVSVPVTLPDASGVASLRAQINYDPVFLEAQGVTNNGAGDPVYVGYTAVQGAFDLFLGTAAALTGGSRTMALMEFRINPGAQPGDYVPLVVADHDLGDEHGGSVRWKTETSSTDGGVWVVHSALVDSDNDGLSDYDEQMLNGSPDYSPGDGDTDINNPDTDGDGLPDGWEAHNSLNPLSSSGVDGASGDLDRDGASNYDEYVADTIPTNKTSFLGISSIQPAGGGVRIDWHGGQSARQYLEFRTNLMSSTEQWTAIYTNEPTTPVINTITDMGATNRTLFYRIRAARP